eukprot:jgi/Bigna1/81873/fgenesh1_pg.85_\
MSLLDDILAGVEETYGGGGGKSGSENLPIKASSTTSNPMQSFQDHLRRRAQQQAKRFRQKIQKMMEKFKASADSSTQFTNETEEQRRYIIHEVAADFGFFSRDEDPSEGGGGVKAIAVYKEAPSDEKALSYEDLSQFQKAEMSRQMALEKRKGKKKKQAEMEKKLEKRLRDPRTIATRLIAHQPRDKRSMLEIARDVRRQKKLQKEAELKKVAAAAGDGSSTQEGSVGKE